MGRSEQAPHKRRGRRAYLEDFQKDPDGKYVYTGEHYAYADAGGRSRRRLLTGLWISFGLAAAAILTQGFLPAEGMRGCVYVLLPYVGALASGISLLWALARLSFHKEPLRAYVYTATAAALPRRGILTAGFAGATLLGDCVFLAIRGMPRPAVSLSFLGLGLLAVLSTLAGLRWRRGAAWTRTEPEH